MFDLDLGSLGNIFGRRSRSINFITVKKDHMAAGLQIAINWGLVITILVAIALWVSTGVEYYLRRTLNDLNTNVASIGSEVLNRKDQLKGNNIRFESKYLAISQKLNRYYLLANDEKMVDLFGILSAILPDGMRATTLTIQPHSVRIVFFVSGDEEYQALVDFAANLQWLATNSSFQDGKKLIMEEPAIGEIAMASDRASGGTGLEMSFSFDYSIEEAQE